MVLNALDAQVLKYPAQTQTVLKLILALLLILKLTNQTLVRNPVKRIPPPLDLVKRILPTHKLTNRIPILAPPVQNLARKILILVFPTLSPTKIPALALNPLPILVLKLTLIPIQKITQAPVLSPCLCPEQILSTALTKIHKLMQLHSSLPNYVLVPKSFLKQIVMPLRFVFGKLLVK